MIQTQSVAFPAGARQLNGYLAQPEGDGPFPGIVVIHEAFGLNDDIKEITRRFAEEGYAALAVDLFSERNQIVCMFRFMGQMLFKALDNDSVNELKTTLSYFMEQPGVDCERVGAIGFCLGGGFAIAWACTDPRLKAIAPFYGMVPRPIEAVARLCPVVGSYPGKDITTSGGQKLDRALERYHIPHDIKIYPNALHSFFNHGSRYNAEAAQDAWVRVLSFFKEHIQPAQPV